MSERKESMESVLNRFLSERPAGVCAPEVEALLNSCALHWPSTGFRMDLKYEESYVWSFPTLTPEELAHRWISVDPYLRDRIWMTMSRLGYIPLESEGR